MSKFYKVELEPTPYPVIYTEYYGPNHFQSELERGLSTYCDRHDLELEDGEPDQEHEFIVLPLKKGHKQYLYCNNCGLFTHI